MVLKYCEESLEWVMEDKAIVSQKSPYLVEVEEGKKYFWCSCGRSKNQPLSDGSHQGTSFVPVKYEADKSRQVYFCGCKQTDKQPFCDGAHSKL